MTEGTTASFAKELVRRAVLGGAENDSPPGDAELRAAAEDLLSDRDALTRRLLGATDPVPYTAPPEATPGLAPMSY